MKKIIIFSLIFTTILSTSVGRNVYAMDTFYSNNDILFFDSSDTMCASGSASLKLFGANNEEKIFNFWLSQGLSKEQSAGITGNIKNESGYSPFRQQEASTWPTGGYGIAQFTGTQRSNATDFLSKNIGDVFNEYYKDTYGGSVSEVTRFIPAGVSEEVNDKFLLGELNYLASYTSGFDPNSIQTRIIELKTDFNVSYPQNTKLLDYIKTLPTVDESSNAWLYLYEQPKNTKDKSAPRIESSKSILAKYSNNSSSISGCTVGVGGLDFEQAKILGSYYYNNRLEYLSGTGFANPEMSDQCTAFSYYFNQRFITTGTAGSGDGKDVAKTLASNFSDIYNLTDVSNVQPFSIFSLSNSTHGHTGVIAGILSDGSVITIEANSDISSIKEGDKLIEKFVVGDDANTVTGVVSVGHWKDINSWADTMASWGGLSNPSFASPIDQSSVSKKVQEAL